MSKFDYLVGTENDFSGAACDCTLKIWHVFHGPMFCTESTIPRQKGVSIIAMRRIIKEPKRWTVEDQKAGRLPDVGCSVLFTHNNFKCEVIAIDDSVTEDVELALRFSDGSILVCKINKIKPIETPEEKAVRLRSEWVELAFDNIMRKEGLHSTECLDRIKCHFGSAYDALLSGALSAPTKGGE